MRSTPGFVDHYAAGKVLYFDLLAAFLLTVLAAAMFLAGYTSAAQAVVMACR